MTQRTKGWAPCLKTESILSGSVYSAIPKGPGLKFGSS